MYLSRVAACVRSLFVASFCTLRLSEVAFALSRPLFQLQRAYTRGESGCYFQLHTRTYTRLLSHDDDETSPKFTQVA